MVEDQRDSAPVELLCIYPTRILGSDGVEYAARAYGRQGPDGTWIGWFEFGAVDGTRTLVTNSETTQPNRQAVAYWAGGIEPVYLEGAYARAIQPPG